jgi:hypothetical protein
MNEHIQKSHKKFNSRLSLTLPQFWRFLKLNCHDKLCPSFLDFLQVFKHPWFEHKIYKCTSLIPNQPRCNYISTIKINQGHKNLNWTDGRPAVNIRCENSSFLIYPVKIIPEDQWWFIKDHHLKIKMMKNLN